MSASFRRSISISTASRIDEAEALRRSRRSQEPLGQACRIEPVAACQEAVDLDPFREMRASFVFLDDKPISRMMATTRTASTGRHREPPVRSPEWSDMLLLAKGCVCRDSFA
jgi:hypothetical protein